MAAWGIERLSMPASLRYRRFRWFLLCQLLSMIGVWAQDVIVSFLVYRHDGLWSLCGVVELQLIPASLGAFLMGRLADKYPRRTLILLVLGCLALVVTTLYVLQVLGVLSL